MAYGPYRCLGYADVSVSGLSHDLLSDLISLSNDRIVSIKNQLEETQNRYQQYVDEQQRRVLDMALKKE